MSVDRVRESLQKWGLSGKIQEFDSSSATVELAAACLGVEAARIAKTISLSSGEGCILLVTAGDVNIDNKKFKAAFGMKAKMLAPEAAYELTGYKVGGVCPFDVESRGIAVYCDESLRRFDTVFPSCGSASSAIELSPEQLFEISSAKGWVDVCKPKVRAGDTA